jgi:hypothetical protein
MRVFTTKAFARFQRRERIADRALCHAVDGAQLGKIDAELGHGLIKLRIARPGKGKSGGYRVLVAYRVGRLAVFLYGFAKSDRDNIDDDELELFRERAGQLLSNLEGIQAMIADEKMQEVYCDQIEND